MRNAVITGLTNCSCLMGTFDHVSLDTYNIASLGCASLIELCWSVRKFALEIQLKRIMTVKKRRCWSWINNCWRVRVNRFHYFRLRVAGVVLRKSMPKFPERRWQRGIKDLLEANADKQRNFTLTGKWARGWCEWRNGGNGKFIKMCTVSWVEKEAGVVLLAVWLLLVCVGFFDYLFKGLRFAKNYPLL